MDQVLIQLVMDDQGEVSLEYLADLVRRLPPEKIVTLLTHLAAELDKDAKDLQADEWATEALVPQADWEASAARERPTPMAVMNLAHALQVHPAMIAGKIRYEQHNYRLLSQFVGTGEIRQQLGIQSR